VYWLIPTVCWIRTPAVCTEIFGRRIQGIVNEMGYMVLRTTHTLFVLEAADFVVALV
jgi:N-methylhydantoinase B/oxoprolinase/acetone carboxylase alpha subunit